VRGEVQSEVAKRLGKTQKEYLLREQMRQIQEELGDEDPRQAEINEFRKRIAQAGMPESVRTVAEKELARLERINPASPEYTVARTYLEYLCAVPWSRGTEDSLDINRAQQVLDEDHYNLKEVKERILEYLAVRSLRATTKGPILCFVGPPGVGKTSLGRSIARAMGRKFIRISLGGMKDEAEIRGHRRTYIGALPGRIIQEICRAEANNPVFMLDEVDKIGQDFRGDPSSALLEVLDPEQNNSFADHYLDVPFDLSRVMFITTANIMDPSHALKDRMEVIPLAGYSDEEKLQIAFNASSPSSSRGGLAGGPGVRRGGGAQIIRTTPARRGAQPERQSPPSAARSPRRSPSAANRSVSASARPMSRNCSDPAVSSLMRRPRRTGSASLPASPGPSRAATSSSSRHRAWPGRRNCCSPAVSAR
jgi:ATP-dependent Lon protease